MHEGSNIGKQDGSTAGNHEGLTTGNRMLLRTQTGCPHAYEGSTTGNTWAELRPKDSLEETWIPV